MTEQLFHQIAERTNGDVYIGVVGAVRIGKSTFVKRVMESLVIPNMTNEADRQRAQDELPQSSPGAVIMTAEPKFVPAHGTSIQVGDDAFSFNIRLADCVGYIIDGAKGHEDENGPKLVHTPWSNEPMPFKEAARIGTDKVIRDHSTIGIVMTTDGTVNEFPRSAVEQVEEEIIDQLKEIGKPFVVLLNSRMPAHHLAVDLCQELKVKYNVPVIAAAVDKMTVHEIQNVLKEALYEFPVTTFELLKPEWMDVLDSDHPLKESIQNSLESWSQQVAKIRDVKDLASFLAEEPFVENAEVIEVNAGKGKATIQIELTNEAFQSAYLDFLEEPIITKKDWLLYVKESSYAKKSYLRFHEAIEMAKESGYGVSLPSVQDFQPSAPELIKQNDFFGVRMKAKAPSLHIIRVDMEAEFSPLIGSEFHSQQLLKDLKEAYYHNREALWETSLFGTPLHEMLKESMRFKSDAVPTHAKKRMRETIERMVNEGDRGMVTFIL
ncbi:stage IV sporulation protein A [Paenisporosarcina sp. TG20]|uniref:stage IV sporulation protein A n=1 Tax=Paenisporosarcina sp. TG20 TaxID=1211706 RepID=UPI0002EE3B75|nr:stage IV sporulation protein A [Paenisporosarcina sp. TG20]